MSKLSVTPRSSEVSLSPYKIRIAETLETDESMTRRTTVRLLLSALLLSAPLSAQKPPIGFIEYYGLRHVAEIEIRAVLDVQVGDTDPAFPGEIVNRLEEISGVNRAYVTTVCCESGQSIFYVGVQQDDDAFELRAPPQADLMLPAEVVDTYRRFGEAVLPAVLKGDASEDMSAGHSLMTNPEARVHQEQFIVFAERYPEILRRVLRTSADPEQRAIAAHVLGYVSDKQAVVVDLLYAAQDPDGGVRNNAVRALGAIGILANAEPELGIRIPSSLFVRMLNSVVWSDRNKASGILFSSLTSTRDAETLQQLRKNALPSVVEMARWKTNHAQFCFFILGRMAGISDTAIFEAWSGGEREAAIAAWETALTN